MRALPPARMLELWERGRRRHPVDRALLALGYAYPRESFERLAGFSAGRRDAALLRLRCATFGPRLTAYLDCPRCGERLEFTLDRDDLLKGREWDDGRDEGREVEVRGHRFRLPDSRDLAEVAGEEDPDRAALRLARRCLLDPDRLPTEWTGELLAELEERLGEADPGGNAGIDFNCQCCGHTWDEVFDIGEFFWEEVETASKRLLNEINFLARAYGWSEDKILGLSEERRALYMKLVKT